MRIDFDEFKELSAKERKSGRLNNADRVNLCKLIQKGIEQRVSEEMKNMRPSELLACQELVTDVLEYEKILSNRKNGGEKAVMTKKIKKLEETLG